MTLIIIRLQTPFYNLQFSFQFTLPSQNIRLHFVSSISMYTYLKKATITTFTCAIQGILKNLCNIYFIHNSDFNRTLRLKTFLHFSRAISLLQCYQINKYAAGVSLWVFGQVNPNMQVRKQSTPVWKHGVYELIQTSLFQRNMIKDLSSCVILRKKFKKSVCSLRFP